MPIDVKTAHRASVWDQIQTLLKKPSAEGGLMPKYNVQILHWMDRFQFHVEITPTLKDWQKDPRLCDTAWKLCKALSVLHELSDEAHQNNPAYDTRRDVIANYIGKSILELEIAQLRMLWKARHFTRDLAGRSLDELNQQLDEKRVTYQESLKLHRQTLLQNDNANLTFTFFRSQKYKTSSEEAFIVSRKIYRVIDIGSALNSLIAYLVAIAKTIANVLLVIPVISAIATAIPLTILAVRPWMEHHTRREKILSVMLFVVIVGALAATGLGIAGASVMLAGAVAATFAAIGFWVLYVAPWMERRRAMKQKLTEHNEIKNNIEQIRNTQNHPLTRIEKECLLVLIEEDWVVAAANSHRRTELEALRLTIMYDNSVKQQDLEKNSTLKSLLNNQSYIDAFLIEKLESAQKTIDSEMRSIKATQKEQLPIAANSFLALIGTIFLAIPTPPTLILGASMILISTLIGFAITFDLVGRIKKRLHHTQPTRKRSQSTITTINNALNKLPEKTDSLGKLDETKPEQTQSESAPRKAKPPTIHHSNNANVSEPPHDDTPSFKHHPK